MCATVEPIIDAPPPTGADGGVGVDGVVHSLFGAGRAAVVEDSGAHRYGAEGEDAPACVRDIRGPQPEFEPAASVKCMGIMPGGWRCQGTRLAGSCEVPAVWLGRCRGRG